jgi:hypothetical protein
VRSSRRRPFSGPLQAGLEASWPAASAAAGDAWPAAWRIFNDDVVRDVLPRAQQDFARLDDDRAGAAFLASFDVAIEAVRRGMARVRSCACHAASIWLDTLPLLTVSGADWVAAGRHHLGVPMVPAAAGAAAPQCSCRGRSALADQL